MKYFLFISLILLFAACNNSSLKESRDKAKADSLLHASVYPQEIIKKHYEKKYNNAVWLLYASNFHTIGVIAHRNNTTGNKDTIYKDSSIISFYPHLFKMLDDGRDDTIEFLMWFADSTGKSIFESMQKDQFWNFGFLRESDSIIYRIYGRRGYDDSWMPNKDMKGLMWNRGDSAEMEAKIKNHQPLNKRNEDLPLFNRKDGFYPLDEQNELFIQYLKTHKNQISPPLMRLCKLKKIF